MRSSILFFSVRLSQADVYLSYSGSSFAGEVPGTQNTNVADAGMNKSEQAKPTCQVER
jgi:hypothetical protein